MDESGNIEYFEPSQTIPKNFVELKNGDVLKHMEHDRYFLIINISPEEIRCRPISNQFAKQLELKRSF